MRTAIAFLVMFVVVASGCQSDKPSAKPASGNEANLTQSEKSKIKTIGTLTPVVLFDKLPMPTGIAVSPSGRMFVNFPRWADPVEYTVAEIKGGKAAPFPNLEINKLDESKAADRFVSVQSVVADSRDRLWVLDPASINFQPVVPSGPKLVCIDLKSNEIVKKISFPSNVALKTSYLNDVRFDFSRGSEGMAFITDSSGNGPNGIVVVDLASGKSWRKLNDHPTTKADRNFAPHAEGKGSLMSRPPKGPPAFIKIGSDGIAIDPARKILYYRPLASHKLSSVSLDALADQNMSDTDVAKTVKDLGTLDYASDGMECDSAGNLYLTDYEYNAIHVRSPGGQQRVLVQNPALIWPDSMAIGTDQNLYVTANQLNRQKQFHEGEDQRKPPFVVFKTRALAGPQK
ncbi:MAG TPA: L-dopachrome tautomerase-related protein [Tepidisphaeraceae bacterium]|jgi:sugar lactone lactonase YvrE|nr:L-dopachrome tautomerase-related protein [Tepidisphaeraceae bacterium]